MDKGDRSPGKKDLGIKMASSPDKMKDADVKIEPQTPGSSKVT